MVCILWANGIAKSMNAPSLFGLSNNVMFCPLTGNDPSRICSCHFTVGPTAPICNVGIIIIIIIILL